ncbi:MAG: DUF6036 family nucleotidyltransferase [Pseudomonadota bacterium]
MKTIETIKEFDKFLNKRGLTFSAIVVGGSALALLGIISRETQDCDILDPDIPDEIQNAAKEFAKQESLKDHWLNNGPSTLKRDLPSGWMLRLTKIFSGEAMTLYTLSRMDLLRSKLFAYCDRGFDLQDCLALKPTPEELQEILPWLQERDGNPDWSEHVAKIISDLAQRLGHEL